jgi:hypothetical protein
LKSLVYFGKPYKIENFETFNATCCLLKKPEKLKTLEILKNNRVSSPKP